MAVPAVAPAMLDLVSDNVAPGTWKSSTLTIRYTPTNQSVSFNKTKELIQFNSAFPADTAESALAVNATSDTGLAKAYVNSATYNIGDFIDVNANVYRVIKGGTSAQSGNGPTGNGSSIQDGSMTVAYQCPDQCNGKFPLFVSHKAKSGAGHVWSGALDLVLDAGYRGGFATSLEVDMTNNSGRPQPATNALFLTGLAGSHPIQNGLSIYSGSGTNYWSKTAINIYGAKVAQDQAIYVNTGSNFAVLDEGRHINGILLNGAYSGAALKTTGEIDAAAYRGGGKRGVTCPAGTVNLSTLEVTNGIITHC
jgi:hypothetical protein